MPSPIGHSLTGFALYWALEGAQRPALTRSDLVLCGLTVIAANLPDLDFLLNIATGRNYHAGFTHSLLAVAVVALGAWVLSYVCKQRWARRVALLVGLGVLSHVLLDSLAADTVTPLGIALLWPFTDWRFVSPVALLPQIVWQDPTDICNMPALAIEAMVFLAMTALVVWCTGGLRRVWTLWAGLSGRR